MLNLKREIRHDYYYYCDCCNSEEKIFEKYSRYRVLLLMEHLTAQKDGDDDDNHRHRKTKNEDHEKQDSFLSLRSSLFRQNSEK